MEKKITMDEFINRYSAMKSDEAKKNYLKSLIRQTYCPVAEKYGILQVMVDKSITTQSDGLKYVDLFVYRINYAMGIILMYTNIVSGEKTAMDYYDFIFQNNILEKILECIDDAEVEEVVSISSNLLVTFENKNSTMSLINRMIESNITIFAKVLSENSNKLADVLSDDSKINKIINVINNLRGGSHDIK